MLCMRLKTLAATKSSKRNNPHANIEGLTMHASRYNTHVRVDDEHLLYNSSTGAFGVLDSVAWKSYESPRKGDDTLVTQLIDAGFLTESSPEEELALIQTGFDAQRADESVFELVIAPTYACNFRCPYCYEQGHNAISGIMNDDVIDALCAFAADRWKATHFTQMNVQWYGGDPSLALSCVEQISKRLIDLCDEHDVLYSAMILSNCNLIDKAAVDLFTRCRISELFITVDGPEELHNARRVAADGSNSFQKQLAAARLCIEAGIQVRANMNADKVNLAHYPEIAAYLYENLGVQLTTSVLCDYGHFFGTRNFAKPAFDLFTHEEYAHLNHDAFVKHGFTAQQIRAMLTPHDRFCRGQRDAYFVVDVIGDVYRCDGYMGEQGHRSFNLLDGYDEDDLHRITFDATRDALCSTCTILPLCQGNCIWERRKTEMPCHPLKYTLSDYLHDWRSCFGSLSEHFTLLAAPLNR